MNKVAYLTTEFAIRKIYEYSKARVSLHQVENIPEGSIIFVVNHFTRIETIFLGVHIQKVTSKPVWALADATLFKGFVGEFISQLGAISTHDPDRDKLMVQSLLTGEANWIIFPEGLMVKNKKLMQNGEFMVGTEKGSKKPHTGAGTLALRTEFYRERLRYLAEHDPKELQNLLDLFKIESLDPVLARSTYIVPVNITYYPIRSRENILSKLAERMMENPSDRMIEEIMTEGTMILSGVDVDVRFGEAIKIKPYMMDPVIQWDICSKEHIRFDDDIASKQMLAKLSRNIMHGYMTSIYNMTTVNHDHLFASVLYRMQDERIEIDDLKRRVYLAATLDMCDEKCFKHLSMHDNQIHLLTDDRYHKFENFITFAVEKGLLTVENGTHIVKNMEAFCEEPDFHASRVENPLIVMANEVEPLTLLQYNIQLLAGTTPPNIRGMVFEQLYLKGLRDFERDYTEYYVENESKPKDIGRPFLMDGTDPAKGVVLIHGYMAAPEEIRGLAKFLNSKGYGVYAPRLKGHGTSPDDLVNRNYMEWIEAVEEGAVMMTCRYDQVIAGGFSTGAGLALDICSRLKSLKAVFAVSPPMKLRDFSAKFIPAVSVWNMLMNKFRMEAIKKDFVENNPENPHINYTRNPIAGVRELERLMKDLEDRLPLISVPAFVLQSGIDPVVNVKGTQRVFERIGSGKKEYHLFNIDRHGILIGEGSERVYETIANFLNTL